MKLLIVCMADSIHIARWVAQLNGQGWDIHLFPSIDVGTVHPLLRGVTVHHSFYSDVGATQTRSVRLLGWRLPRPFDHIGRYVLKHGFPEQRARQLAWLIEQLQPDVVHSIEFQHAGYLTLAARRMLSGPFPVWIVTNWGNDLYLFGRMPEHVEPIRTILALCDYYTCECARDAQLARDMGYRREIWPVMPNTGGLDLTAIEPLRQPTAARRIIMIKGYQGLMGRSLVALDALAQCADVLSGYRVVVYSAHSPDVAARARQIAAETGLSMELLPQKSHDDMLRLFGQARVYIGLSLSDGVSTSALEALAMGAFPIQSNTACIDEWITDGETGFIVPPEDAETVASALRRAVTDDALVEHAAELNARTAASRLDGRKIAETVIDLYRSILAKSPTSRSSETSVSP